MGDYELDELQAFDAVRIFLAEWARQTKSRDVARLVDEIYYSDFYTNGKPILGDQGNWDDWLRAIQAALANHGRGSESKRPPRDCKKPRSD